MKKLELTDAQYSYLQDWMEFTFHDLCLMFGSITENLDYGRYTIKRFLSHKDDDDRDVTAGYIQVSDKKLREAMNAIENIVLSNYRNLIS